MEIRGRPPSDFGGSGDSTDSLTYQTSSLTNGLSIVNPNGPRGKEQTTVLKCLLRRAERANVAHSLMRNPQNLSDLALRKTFLVWRICAAVQSGAPIRLPVLCGVWRKCAISPTYPTTVAP